MANIIPFTFNNNTVRSFDREGQVWFVANDIAGALGYTNPREALRKHVDEEDKTAITFRDIRSKHVQDRNVNVINESGMYSLVLRSRKPEARVFKRWVTSEVLPAIRQQGNYTLDKWKRLTHSVGATAISVVGFDTPFWSSPSCILTIAAFFVYGGLY